MPGVSRRVALLALALVAALLVPAQVEAAGSAPVTLPKAPKGLKAPVKLPTTLDPVPRYQPQSMCWPIEQPGITKLKALVLATYKIGGKGNTARGCTEGVSEHADGRAWDWMVNTKVAKEKAAAADFLSWVTKNNGENARRLGIQYVIYNEKIWGAYRAKDGWRKSSGHKDHIHISTTWNGARGNVSFWTGKVAATDLGPCAGYLSGPTVLINSPRTGSCKPSSALIKKTKRPVRVYGDRGSANVEVAQKALGIKVTRTFDSTTWNAIRKFQVAHDLPHTGALDQPTYAALLPKEVTSNVLGTYTARTAAAKGLASYASATLGGGSIGTGVGLLQTALALPVVDRNGYYGAVTTAAVKKFQAAQKLPVTGAFTKADWQALVAVAK